MSYLIQPKAGANLPSDSKVAAAVEKGKSTSFQLMLGAHLETVHAWYLGLGTKAQGALQWQE